MKMNTKEFLQICILWTGFFALFFFLAATIAWLDPSKYIFLMLMLAYVGGLIIYVHEVEREKTLEEKKVE